jgi:hypothetical protein
MSDLGARHLALGLALVGLTGCQSTIHPRPARVAQPGRLAWDVHLPLAQVAPARLGGTAGSASVDSAALSTGMVASGGSWVPPIWFDGSLRYGVFSPCEVGGLLSPLRVGAEARCQLVDGPVDLSLSAGGAYLPFFDRGLWGRAGFDLSRHFSKYILMSGLYLASGPASWWVEFVRAPDGVSDPVDPQITDQPAPGIQATRDEQVLAVPVGVSWLMDDPHVEAFTLGLVFRQVLSSGAPSFSKCSGCSTFEGERLQIGPSVTLVLGLVGAP